MKMKKSLIAILTATIFILSTMAPLVSVKDFNPTDPASWYTTVVGNLSNDTYTLYPYDAKNLTLGLSKFGELINPYTNLGLSYGPENMDPFANFKYIPEFEWSQGWLVNLTYTYGDEYRNIWAYALYSDLYSQGSIGGDWIQAYKADNTTVLGGRKYGGTRYNSGNPLQIGYVSTAPLLTLFDSPREWIALSRTTIGEDANTPLVGVYLTFIFNKDTKYVTVYKDIKLLDGRKLTGPIQVEFSNRGEWDLGKTQAPPVYADFFTGLDTAYESGYHPYYPTSASYDLAQMISTTPTGYVAFAAYWPQPISEQLINIQDISRSQILSSLSTTTAVYTADGVKKTFSVGAGTNYPSAVPYPHIDVSGNAIWDNEPMVFVNGFKVPKDPIAQNGYLWNGQTVTFNNAPAPGVAIWLVYKQHLGNEEMIGDPGVPYTIAEWDFDLSNINKTASSNMFRAVTVYGLTDNHDATDDAFGASKDNIDREVTYMMAQVFNPWSLNSAVEKSTERWVWFGFPAQDGDWDSTMPSATQSSWPLIAQSPVLNIADAQWDQYSTFAERVIDMNTSTLCYRTSRANDLVAGANETYDFGVEGGIGFITGLDPTHYYKILYSTDTQTDTLKGDLTNSVTGLTGTQLNTPFDWSESLGNSWTDSLNVHHDVYTDDFNFGIMNFTNMPDENLTWTYNAPALQWEANPFIVPPESTTTYLETGAQNFETVNVTTPLDGLASFADAQAPLPLQFSISNLELDWGITPPQDNNFMNLRSLYVDGWDFDVVPVITVTYGNSTAHPALAFTVTVTISFVPDNIDSNLLFSEYIAGRYELGVVGRSAASVDSAGLSMISAALKDKGDEYSIAAEDMYDPVIANQMPYVMSKVGTGNTVTDYYYSGSDFRTGLKDDWCTTYPVSSANLVASGGPLANLLAYYGNDFATAFYGLGGYTNGGTPWFNAIVPLACWNATSEGYTDTNAIGYAVISTFQDLNGTEVLMVWGNWGRDTYYASQWFYMDGIKEFQSFPNGVNSIVLQINYKNSSSGYKPTLYTVKEMLGTISETGMYDSSAFMTSPMKGGIHPDP
jgi:hypothetical protein